MPILPATVSPSRAQAILDEQQPHALQLTADLDGTILLEDPWFSRPARLDSEGAFRAQVAGLLTGKDTPVHVWRYGYAPA